MMTEQTIKMATAIYYGAATVKYVAGWYTIVLADGTVLPGDKAYKKAAEDAEAVRLKALFEFLNDFEPKQPAGQLFLAIGNLPDTPENAKLLAELTGPVDPVMLSAMRYALEQAPDPQSSEPPQTSSP